MSRFRFYVGVDWGASESVVHVVDAAGVFAGEGRVENATELIAFIRRWTGNAAPSLVAVAIERSDLALVDAMLEVGFAVFTLNPKQVDRFRDRLGPSGAKDDRRDARVLSSALRTDGHAFRRVQALSSEEVRLRGLHRCRDQVVQRRRSAANQLAAEVFRVLPGLLALCSGADRVWFRKVVALLIKESDPRKVTAERFQDELGRTSKVNGDDVAAAVAAGHPPSGALWSCFCFSARALVAELALAGEQQRELERELQSVLRSMRGPSTAPSDVDIVSSMPGLTHRRSDERTSEIGSRPAEIGQRSPASGDRLVEVSDSRWPQTAGRFPITEI